MAALDSDFVGVAMSLVGPDVGLGTECEFPGNDRPLKGITGTDIMITVMIP